MEGLDKWYVAFITYFDTNIFAMEYEIARTNLEALKKWYEHRPKEMNEADTRFHLIDELLVNCLGWQKDDIKSEQSQDSEYADYTLYISERRCFIIEAKRISNTFELPAGLSKTEYKLSSLVRDNPEFAKAIDQVIGYCNKRGVEFAAVSNGHQIIGFLASRNDGVAPLDGNAIVFSSLQSMCANFLQMWNTFSRTAIAERRLILQLQESTAAVLPLKLLSQIYSYPRIATRNDLQADLQVVSEVVLENVNKHEDILDDFLKDTYCNSGTLSQYALISKSILTNRYALLFDDSTGGPAVKEAVTKKGVSPEVFAESLSSSPILLLGDVGSGKTMFINYFLRIEASEIVKKSFTIYVDLGSKAALVNDLNEFFLDELIRVFKEKHEVDFYEDGFVRGVYNLDLKDFSKGIYGKLKDIDPHQYLVKEIDFLDKKINQKSEHIKASLKHITKGWKRQVIIFMDNVDQREENIQERAFLVANEIASTWPATVFLTLRPTTFYKSKKEGTLTGYHPKAFSISPPRVDSVLIKRLEFALKITQGELKIEGLTSTFQVKLETLSQFIEIMLHSLSYNKDLVEFIDNISYGNIRKSIEYLSVFIGSGHINTRKIIELDTNAYSEGKRYTVALHEFLRAIVYEDYQDYFPDASDIANLFDVIESSREHFISSLCLDYLLRKSNSSQNGFISTNDIIEYLQDSGFKFHQIEHCLLRLVYKGLLETEARKLLNLGDSLPKSIRITSIGSYHLQKLISSFVYIDAIIVDVPIFNEQIRAGVKDEQQIFYRLKRCQSFCKYLDDCWADAGFTNTGFDWPQVSENLKKEIARIEHSLH